MTASSHSRARRAAAAAASLMALALAGCLVGPRFVPPKADVPAAWSAARAGVTSAEPSDAAWWSSFGDPELTSLIERALGASFETRQAVLRIDEARAQRRMAAAGAWPQLDAVGSYANTRISERTAMTSLLSSLGGARGAAPGGVSAAFPGLKNPFDLYDYGLTGSWELDLFGRVRRTVEAADANTAAAIEDGRAVRVALAAEVGATYVDLRGTQALEAAAEARLATARAVLRLAQDARRAGLGDDRSLSAAAAAVGAAEALLPPLESQAEASRSQLALLLAAKPGALDAELADPKALPPLPATVPAGLPSDLARRRPDVRRAEAQLHAAVAQQGVAAAALFPSIVLQASAGYQASRPAALTDWAARYLTLGPSLDLPVFDAGQRRANVQLQDVRAKQAALAYAQTVLNALHEVEDAMTAYGQERSRQDSLQAVFVQDRGTLDLTQRRYRAGSANYREVLDAQDRLQAAQEALIASTSAAGEDLIALYRALGGGWERGAAEAPA
jgi:NodT family efflux transporter outer membrane factor (OMF) lipoprotein